MKKVFTQGEAQTPEQHEIKSIVMEQASEISAQLTELECREQNIEEFEETEDEQDTMTEYADEAQDIYNRNYDQQMDSLYSFVNLVLAAVEYTEEAAKDKLPPIQTYSGFLQVAVREFKITMNEARDRYGLYTLEQWEQLFENKTK